MMAMQAKPAMAMPKPHPHCFKPETSFFNTTTTATKIGDVAVSSGTSISPIYSYCDQEGIISYQGSWCQQWQGEKSPAVVVKRVHFWDASAAISAQQEQPAF